MKAELKSFDVISNREVSKAMWAGKALLTQKQKPSVRFFLKLRDLPVYQWEKLWLLPWVF